MPIGLCHYPSSWGDNMENSGNQPYPVQFDVDYPEGGGTGFLFS